MRLQSISNFVDQFVEFGYTKCNAEPPIRMGNSFAPSSTSTIRAFGVYCAIDFSSHSNATAQAATQAAHSAAQSASKAAAQAASEAASEEGSGLYAQGAFRLYATPMPLGSSKTTCKLCSERACYDPGQRCVRVVVNTLPGCAEVRDRTGTSRRAERVLTTTLRRL